MADTGETTFVFKANTKPAEEQLDKFGDSVIGIGKKIGAAVLAYASFSALKAGLEKAIDGAMEAEEAVLAFNSALSMSGKYTEAASLGFQEFASSLEKTTGIQDEIILKNSALLISLGKLSGDGLERATKAALDLSRGMQIDVGTAFDMVTKATQGNVMALARYGLEVNKSDSDSMKFAKTLSFIEDRFGGMAAGNINTFTGALNHMKLGMDDIFESIGKLITSSPKAIAVLKLMGDEFYKISGSIATSKSGLDKFIDIAFTIGSVIATILTPFEGVIRFMASNLLNMPLIMLGVFEKIAMMSDKFLGTNMGAKINEIRTSLGDLQQSIISPVFGEEEMFTTKLANGLDAAKEKVNDLASTMTTVLPAASESATVGMESSWDQFFSGFKAGLQDMSKSISDLGKQVASTFVNGFSNAFASMGKAIVKGQNVLAAFGGAILSTLGAIAIQMGQFYIAAGLATMFLNPASGIGMILAGGALATLGGVLQALGSGGDTPAAGGSSGGGTVGQGGTSGGGSMFDVQTPEEERAKAQTGVSVVVQGNIFDSKETGLQIANILNESFDTNGTIVRAFA